MSQGTCLLGKVSQLKIFLLNTDESFRSVGQEWLELFVHLFIHRSSHELKIVNLYSLRFLVDSKKRSFSHLADCVSPALIIKSNQRVF